MRSACCTISGPSSRQAPEPACTSIATGCRPRRGPWRYCPLPRPRECAQCAFWVRLLIWATRRARAARGSAGSSRSSPAPRARGGRRPRRRAGSGRRSGPGPRPSAIISNSRAAEACSSAGLGDIIGERRPGQEQRAAARQLERADRRHRARGVAVADHQPAPGEARQRRRPARRADPVEHAAHAAAGDGLAPARQARRTGSSAHGRRRARRRAPLSRPSRHGRSPARRSPSATATRIEPTPPAAAWTSTQSPARTRAQRSTRNLGGAALEQHRRRGLGAISRRAAAPAGRRR